MLGAPKLNTSVPDPQIDFSEYPSLGEKLRASIMPENLVNNGVFTNILKKTPNVQTTAKRGDIIEAHKPTEQKMAKSWLKKTRKAVTKRDAPDNNLDLVSVDGSVSSSDESTASLWSMVIKNIKKKKDEEERGRLLALGVAKDDTTRDGKGIKYKGTQMSDTNMFLADTRKKKDFNVKNLGNKVEKLQSQTCLQVKESLAGLDKAGTKSKKGGGLSAGVAGLQKSAISLLNPILSKFSARDFSERKEDDGQGQTQDADLNAPTSVKDGQEGLGLGLDQVKPSPSNIDSMRVAIRAKVTARMWKNVTKRKRLDTACDAYSNTSLDEQNALLEGKIEIDNDSSGGQKMKGGLENKNDKKTGGGGGNTKQIIDGDPPSSENYKCKEQKFLENINTAIARDELECCPEFMRRFLYKDHPQSPYRFIRLNKHYVAIQDNLCQYLGCIDGRVDKDAICVFASACKGNKSQLWTCKFRDLNPTGPSFRFTIHNRANPSLALDVGDESLSVKKLKCGFDSNYHSTEYKPSQLFKVNDSYSDILNHIPSLTMTPPHMKTMTFDVKTQKLLGEIQAGNTVNMEPCKGNKFQRFHITSLKDRPGCVTIDLHFHLEVDEEEPKKNQPKKNPKKKKQSSAKTSA